jgi:hypothetical protein
MKALISQNEKFNINYISSWELEGEEYIATYSKIEDCIRIAEVRPDDETFKSWASVEDVKLVRERARLKRCIDTKLLSIIHKVNNGEQDGGFNPEVKKYGL